MQFLALGLEVMAQRERDGVRGIDREWSRWRTHIAPSTLAQKDVRELEVPAINEAVEVESAAVEETRGLFGMFAGLSEKAKAVVHV